VIEIEILGKGKVFLTLVVLCLYLVGGKFSLMFDLNYFPLNI